MRWSYGARVIGMQRAPIMGLVKPNGFPTMRENALSNGMLLYAFDTGTGLYSLVKDCSPTHYFNPDHYYGGSPNYSPSGGGGTTPFDPKQSLTPSESSTYGTANRYPGMSQDAARPGGGAIIQLSGSDDLRTAINLASAGSGAACTIFATHMQVGACRSGMICGRVGDMDNFHDICAIRADGGGSTGSKLLFGWAAAADNTSPQFLESTDPCGINVLCTSVISMVNTSAGVTDIKMYVNGVQQAHAAGQAVCDIAASTAYNEDQWMTGADFHVYAGQWYNVFNGYVYQFGIANRAWSQADAQSLSDNPYQLLVL